MLLEKKFSVRKAITALSKSDDRREIRWHLSRALAWAFLDQKTQKKPRRAKNAQHVGQIILSQWMAEQWPDIKQGTSTAELRELVDAYELYGGVIGTLKTPAPRRLKRRFQKVLYETQFVSAIVLYLCRLDADPSADRTKLTIDIAKLFVENVQPDPKARKYGSSKISKIWEKYARSAALIFAVHQVFPRLNQEDLLSVVTDTAKDLDQLRRLLGYASYGAGVLAKTDVRKAFTVSFQPAIPRSQH